MEESVRHLYYNSPNMRKTLLASCRSQFLLDRLGKCLKLFVSTVGTSCHKFASQYGLEMFLYAKLGPKTTPNTGCCAAARQRIVCRSRSTDRQRQRALAATTEGLAVSDRANTGKCNNSKRQEREIIPSRLEKMWFSNHCVALPVFFCNVFAFKNPYYFIYG